jgi:flagellar hook-length control protein FliK
MPSVTPRLNSSHAPRPQPSAQPSKPTTSHASNDASGVDAPKTFDQALQSAQSSNNKDRTATLEAPRPAPTAKKAPKSDKPKQGKPKLDHPAPDTIEAPAPESDPAALDAEPSDPVSDGDVQPDAAADDPAAREDLPADVVPAAQVTTATPSPMISPVPKAAAPEETTTAAASESAFPANFTDVTTSTPQAPDTKPSTLAKPAQQSASDLAAKAQQSKSDANPASPEDAEPALATDEAPEASPKPAPRPARLAAAKPRELAHERPATPAPGNVPTLATTQLPPGLETASSQTLAANTPKPLQLPAEESPASSTPAQPTLTSPAPAAQPRAVRAESAQPAQDLPTPDPQQTFDQIILGLHGKFDPRAGKAEIRLEPPNLGPVKVSVSLENGALTAEFQSSSDLVRGLLKDNMEKLKSVLESRGVAVDRLAVDAPRDAVAAPTGQGQSAFGDASHDGRSANQYQQDPRSANPRRPDAAFAALFKNAAAAPVDLVA